MEEVKVTIANLGHPNLRWTMMRDAVLTLREGAAQNSNLFYPIIHFIATCIDGLAHEEPGGVGERYRAYLDKHFPDLCKEISSAEFYTKVRCKAVHEFGLDMTVGMGRRGHFEDGSYAKSFKWESQDGVSPPPHPDMVVVNTDRLADDFLRHVEGLLSGAIKP